MLIKEASNPIASIVDCIYPQIQEGSIHSSYFHERTMLAPTMRFFTKVNEHILSLISGEERLYLSSNSIDKSNGNYGTTILLEFLNSIPASGVPKHKLLY